MLDPRLRIGRHAPVSAATTCAKMAATPSTHDVLRAGEGHCDLCLMNMAVHGMQACGDIKSGDAANLFAHDAHKLEGHATTSPPTLLQRRQGEGFAGNRCCCASFFGTP